MFSSASCYIPKIDIISNPFIKSIEEEYSKNLTTSNLSLPSVTTIDNDDPYFKSEPSPK